MCDRGGPVFLGAQAADREGEGFGVDVDVEAIAVAGERGVDGFARGAIVGEEERPIDGQALGACDGQGVAVLETDVAVDVAGFVGVEGDVAAVFGGGGDPDAVGVVFVHGGDVGDGDDGAVEQLVVKDGGSDAEEISACDVELERLLLPRVAARCGDRDLRAIGVGRQGDCAQDARELADFAVGPGDDERRCVGVLLAVGDPVLRELRDGVVVVRFEVEPSAGDVGFDCFLRMTLADGFGGLGLPSLRRVRIALR